MANILTLDPQVQTRIIDLAWQWVKNTIPVVTGRTQEEGIEVRAKGFDQAFKAILKTYLPEQTGAAKTKTF